MLSGPAELFPEGRQSPVEAALHGHGADIQGGGGPPVAPSLQHDPPQHLLAPGVQARQKLLHPRQAFFGGLLGVFGGGGQLVQQLAIQGGGTAQLAVTTQQAPLLHAHAQTAAQVSIRSGMGRGLTEPLFLQTGQTGPQLALSPGQAHHRRRIPQVMEDRAPDVGAGKGREGGLLGLAVQLRGPDQAEQADLNQILPRLLAAAPVMDRHGRNEVPVGFDQGVAAFQRGGPAGRLPVATGVETGWGTGAGVHGFSVFKGVSTERRVFPAGKDAPTLSFQLSPATAAWQA